MAPQTLESSTPKDKTIIAKLLNRLWEAQYQSKAPTEPVRQFGEHVLVFVLKNGKTLSVTNYWVPLRGSEGYGVSPTDILVSSSDGSRVNRYRDPPLAQWLWKGWRSDFPQAATTWHVGQFTISTHLLPKVYDPHGSWNSMDLTPSALYYVPKSTPTELLAQSVPSGKTHVIAKLDCTDWGGPGGSPPAVWVVSSSYLLVECGYPPNSDLLQGILVDTRTGTQWTLWTDGQENSDGWYGGRAWVYGGWVYFETYTVAFGHGLVQWAMNLATGATKPAPFPLGQYVAAYRAPDGTLYGMKWSSSASVDSASVDLYRLNGPFESTLVAENLPVALGKGIFSNADD